MLESFVIMINRRSPEPSHSIFDTVNGIIIVFYLRYFAMAAYCFSGIHPPAVTGSRIVAGIIGSASADSAYSFFTFKKSRKKHAYAPLLTRMKCVSTQWFRIPSESPQMSEKQHCEQLCPGIVMYISVQPFSPSAVSFSYCSNTSLP